MTRGGGLVRVTMAALVPRHREEDLLRLHYEQHLEDAVYRRDE